MELRLEDVDIHISDQRIGMGIGGIDCRMRFYHKPTETLIELKSKGAHWKTRELGLSVLSLIIQGEPDAF